jgi:hypothetical protein
VNPSGPAGEALAVLRGQFARHGRPPGYSGRFDDAVWAGRIASTPTGPALDDLVRRASFEAAENDCDIQASLAAAWARHSDVAVDVLERLVEAASGDELAVLARAETDVSKVADLCLWSYDGFTLWGDVAVEPAALARELRVCGTARALYLLEDFASLGDPAVVAEVPAAVIDDLGVAAFAALSSMLGDDDERWDLFEGLVADATCTIGELVERCFLVAS